MKSIFVSSTFSDMQEERDALMIKILPELNIFAKEYLESIKLVDLRWGIDTSNFDDELSNQKVLSVCLDEIDRSNPYMLVFVGSRYGWIPSSERLKYTANSKNYVLDEFEKSVTALEIEYGALSKKGDLSRCLFYFRDIINKEKIPTELKDSFVDKELHLQKRLDNLKEKIVRSGCNVKNYSCSWDIEKNSLILPDNFCSIIIEDVKNIIIHDFKDITITNELEKELIYSDTYARQKSVNFAARYKFKNHLIREFSNKDKRLFFIRATSGMGKSTLMAKMYQNMQKLPKSETLFIACGNSPKSQTSIDLIHQINHKMQSLLKIKAPDDNATLTLNDFVIMFLEYSFLYKQKSDKTLYIFIDALDQLTNDKTTQELLWLPNTLPENIKIIVSLLDTTKIPVIYPLQKLSAIIDIEKLTDSEQIKVISKALKNIGKELNETLISKTLTLNGSSNPLYLSMAIQRLAMLNSKDFGIINSYGGNMKAINQFLSEKIDLFPDSVQGMSKEVLAEAAAAINKEFCMTVSSLLATSRRGLRESDLEILVSAFDINWSNLEFSMFFKYMRPFFMVRDDDRIDFAHKAIKEGFISITNTEIYNTAIFNYLKTLSDDNEIKNSEIAWHAYKENDKQFLSANLEKCDQLSEPATNSFATTLHEISLLDNDWIVELFSYALTQQNKLNIIKFINKNFYKEFDKSDTEAEILIRILTELSHIFTCNNIVLENTFLSDETILLFENIGDIYAILNDLENAIIYFNKAFDLSQVHNNIYTFNKPSFSISTLFKKKKPHIHVDYDRLFYVKTTHSRIINKLGNIKEDLELYDEALLLYKNSLQNLTQTQHYCGIRYLADAEVKPYETNITRSALFYLYEEQAKTNLLIGDYYEINGDFEKAYNHYETAHEKTYGIEQRTGDLTSQKLNALSIQKIANLNARCGVFYVTSLKFTSLAQLYKTNKHDNPFLQFADSEELKTLENFDNLNSLALVNLRKLALNKSFGTIFIGLDKFYESLNVFNQLNNAFDIPITKRNLSIAYELIGDIDFSYGNIPEAFETYNKCLVLCEELCNKNYSPEHENNYASVLSKIADIHQICNYHDKALKYYKHALILKERHQYKQLDKQKLAQLYEKIGDVNLSLKNTQEANLYFDKSITLLEQIIEHHNVVKAMHVQNFTRFKIAKLHSKKGCIDLAKKQYELCLSEAKLKFDLSMSERKSKKETRQFAINVIAASREYVVCLSNIAYEMRQLKNKNYALKLCEKSHEEDYDGIPLNSVFLGDFYNVNCQFKKAVEFYTNIINHEKKDELAMNTLSPNKTWNLATCLERVGEIYLSSQDTALSIETFEECIKYRKQLAKTVPKTHALRELSNSYVFLSIAFEKMGDTEKALKYNRKAVDTLEKVKAIYDKSNLPYIDTINHFNKNSNIFRLSIDTFFEMYV